MHKENSSFKSDHYPTQRYDYDGIAGMWLLIPSKFHILALALLVPIILWVLPNIHFKGSFHFFLLDYRYYIAGLITIFFISSAILSIIKAKQVKLKIRPLSQISPQVTEKKTDKKNRNTPSKSAKIAPKINNVKQNPTTKGMTNPQITIKKSNRTAAPSNSDSPANNGQNTDQKIAIKKDPPTSVREKTPSKKTSSKTKINLKNQNTSAKTSVTEEAIAPLKANETTEEKISKKRATKKKESTKTTTSKKTTKTALTKKAKQLELDL